MHRPYIRNYDRYRDIHRNRAQRAWIKLKHISAGIIICSKKIGEKVAKCSRVVGNALSHIPGASSVSNLAHGAYDSIVSLKYATTRKSINALNKLRSMVSSAHPYEPILPPPSTRAVSPRILPHVVEPIQPLSYGGRNSLRARNTTRKAHNYRRTKKH